MQVEKRAYCHCNLVRFVPEHKLIDDDGTFWTLSVIDPKKGELMIFLGKEDHDSMYEVRVCKSKTNDRYVPHEADEVSKYEESLRYTTFFFDNFNKAKNFIATLNDYHKEYMLRPVVRQ